MPFESTQTISVIGSWFNHPEDSTIRDVEELEEIFPAYYFKIPAISNVLSKYSAGHWIAGYSYGNAP